MLLFDSIVFGAFVGFLTNFWLGLFKCSEPARLIITVIVAVLVAILVDTHNLVVF